MNKENLEIIIEQLEVMEDAFNTLEDGFYQIRKCFQNELTNQSPQKVNSEAGKSSRDSSGDINSTKKKGFGRSYGYDLPSTNPAPIETIKKNIEKKFLKIRGWKDWNEFFRIGEYSKGDQNLIKEIMGIAINETLNYREQSKGEGGKK